MPINHGERYIFVHIPKTAGSTILDRLNIDRTVSNFFGGQFQVRYYTVECVAQHMPAFLIRKIRPDIFDKYYKFSFIRNPYDRVLSEFFWCRKNANLESKTEDEILSDFNQWLEPYYLTKNTSRKFSQRWFLYSRCKKHLLVDEIYRYENFEQEFSKLVEKLKIKIPERYSLKSRNISTLTIDKNILLTKKNKDFIYSNFKDDFETFNYPKEFTWVPKNIV